MVVKWLPYLGKKKSNIYIVDPECDFLKFILFLKT